jgi:hypothetical protein
MKLAVWRRGPGVQGFMERLSCLPKIDCQGCGGIGLCDQNDPSSPIRCFFLLRLRRSLELADGGSLFLNHSDTLVVTASPARIGLKNSQPTCGERHVISRTGHKMAYGMLSTEPRLSIPFVHKDLPHAIESGSER